MSKSTAKPMSELVAQWLTFLETTKPTKGDNEMGRYATEQGGREFEQAPADTHIARCIKIIDIGTQHGEYLGAPTVRNQIVVQWELPLATFKNEETGEEQPFIVSRFYTNNLFKKAKLAEDLVSWRGRPFTPDELKSFDLMNILGKPCLVNVVHNEKGKAKVEAVLKPMRGQECPPQINPSFAFWIDEWDQQKFDSLSDGFKKLIQASDEYKAMKAPPQLRPASKQTVAADGFMDDVPFAPRGHRQLWRVM